MAHGEHLDPLYLTNLAHSPSTRATQPKTRLSQGYRAPMSIISLEEALSHLQAREDGVREDVVVFDKDIAKSVPFVPPHDFAAYSHVVLGCKTLIRSPLRRSSGLASSQLGWRVSTKTIARRSSTTYRALGTTSSISTRKGVMAMVLTGPSPCSSLSP